MKHPGFLYLNGWKKYLDRNSFTGELKEEILAVQLFQHSQGQYNMVILKGFQSIWGLDQNAGIQYEGFLHDDSAFL